MAVSKRFVRVRAYVRRRFGKWEHVCSHLRGLPGQLEFAF
jgi:hypothetical protein